MSALWLFVFGVEPGPFAEGDLRWAVEAAQIAAMVRFARVCKVGELGPGGKPALEDFEVWTCSNFDGQNCTAYEARPSMCRDYPYGRPCEHADCTWDDGRVPKLVAREKPPAALAEVFHQAEAIASVVSGRRSLPVVS